MALAQFPAGRDTFSEEQFAGVNLQQGTVDSLEFDACHFEQCSFVESTFEQCRFMDCTFHECIVSAVQFFNSSFNGVQFTNCKVIGIDWTKAKMLSALSFHECDLSYSTFTFLKLKKIKITASICKEVDFVEADLTEGDFEGTDFDQSRFARTNLTGANFRRATNYTIDVQTNILKKARFSLPEAASLLLSLGIRLVEG